MVSHPPVSTPVTGSHLDSSRQVPGLEPEPAPTASAAQQAALAAQASAVADSHAGRGSGLVVGVAGQGMLQPAPAAHPAAVSVARPGDTGENLLQPGPVVVSAEAAASKGVPATDVDKVAAADAPAHTSTDTYDECTMESHTAYCCGDEVHSVCC